MSTVVTGVFNRDTQPVTIDVDKTASGDVVLRFGYTHTLILSIENAREVLNLLADHMEAEQQCILCVQNRTHTYTNGTVVMSSPQHFDPPFGYTLGGTA